MDLADKMRQRADSDGLLPDHPLRKLAAALDATNKPDAADWDAKKMLSAWARARRAWCEYTGEDLV